MQCLRYSVYGILPRSVESVIEEMSIEDSTASINGYLMTDLESGVPYAVEVCVYVCVCVCVITVTFKLDACANASYGNAITFIEFTV